MSRIKLSKDELRANKKAYQTGEANLQLLTKSENSAKGNRCWPDNAQTAENS